MVNFAEEACKQIVLPEQLVCECVWCAYVLNITWPKIWTQEN